MLEYGSGTGSEAAPPARSLEPAFPADSTQRQHYRDIPQTFQFGLQILPAQRQLLARRAIIRRGTPCRRRDIAVGQHHTIVQRSRNGLACPPEAVERVVQPITTRVSGKHSPGSISAMRRGRQTHDEQARVRISKTRDRPAPILLPGEFPLAPPRHTGAILPESGTELAVSDLLSQLGERRQVGLEQP